MAAQQQLKQIFPQWYENWLFNSLEVDEQSILSEDILKPIISLNTHWLQENYDKEEYDWDSELVAKAYALYYMTANLPKLWMILNKSQEWQRNISCDITELTEFGCGPGTFLWSYLFYIAKNNPDQLKKIVKIRGIDHSQENLNVAQRLFKELIKHQEFSHIKAEFKFAEWPTAIDDLSGISQDHHLSIFGNSLIESTDHLIDLKELKINNLLILEPGTHKHFQRLRRVRDQLVENNYTIHFPCPGGGKCPMSDENWCHFNVNRFLLPFMQKISTAAGRRNHKHHFSGFLFSKQNKDQHCNHWRMISNARKAKGSVIRYVCNGQNIKEVVLNKKEKSDSNRDFSNAEMGDLARCSSELKNNRLYKRDSFKL